ncbi:MAG: phosphoribosylformylglycinamidine synthase I [Planctomycetes bacterium]|nr:phosphoribosylformylglycinamidine synthase I [Planctomycetota bacterium]
MKPLALIIRTAGTNCDRELVHAFELAGADTATVHLNELIANPRRLEEIDLLGFPGGFSYGDDIAAGRIFANRLRHRLDEPLRATVARGVPTIGICNGFQVLVKLGLLPEPDARRQTATLADNTSGRFTARWTSVTVPADTACLWTRGLDTFDLPIAHGEGRFVPADDEALRRLRDRRQVALRYVTEKDPKPQASFPGNPNGSTDDIAGVCDPTGVVLGLMPHPERFTHPTQHPLWTRMASEWLSQTPAGLRFFQNAVEHVKAGRTQPAMA